MEITEVRIKLMEESEVAFVPSVRLRSIIALLFAI